MLQTEMIASTWRAAVLDLDSGTGVAVELDPPCDCAACLTRWREDRTAWEADLAILCAAPVAQLPEAPGVLRRLLLGSFDPNGEDGEEVTPWGPDVLPIHAGGAEAVREHAVLGELWARLGEAVAALDSEVDRAAWRG